VAKNVLLYGDCERSAAMRHEVPVGVGDAFLLAEIGGQTYVMVNRLESERIARVRPDAELIDIADLGFYELAPKSDGRDALWLELMSRFVKRIGLRDAVVDYEFPLWVAERLRADGTSVAVDGEQIALRRRAKSEHELAGIRRAQRAAEAGMAAGAAVLRSAAKVGDRLQVDGRDLTAETVRAAIRDACALHGAPAGPDVMVGSAWQGTGHDPGSGPLPAALPIVIDLWPRDEESACFADMTRTFVVGGEPPDEVRRRERLVTEAFEAAQKATRPGVLGRDLHAICCDIFERQGYLTQRTGLGEDPEAGFQFSLGHGVGLMVHEEPSLGMTGTRPLVVGDVLAFEPGLYSSELGGVRFEDLLLVTEDGCENLTRYSYSLTP
jgi:Xaa-Pro aminopeptidase